MASLSGKLGSSIIKDLSTGQKKMVGKAPPKEASKIAEAYSGSGLEKGVDSALGLTKWLVGAPFRVVGWTVKGTANLAGAAALAPVKAGTYLFSKAPLLTTAAAIPVAMGVHEVVKGGNGNTTSRHHRPEAIEANYLNHEQMQEAAYQRYAATANPQAEMAQAEMLLQQMRQAQPTMTAANTNVNAATIDRAGLLNEPKHQLGA